MYIVFKKGLEFINLSLLLLITHNIHFSITLNLCGEII